MSKDNKNCYGITYHSKQYKDKPPTTEIPTIQKELKAVKVTDKELARLVTSGMSWCPGVFKSNSRKKKDWVQCDYFALDFDDGLTPDEAAEKLDALEIGWMFMHTSFSDTPELRKFRIVFRSPVTIDNKKAWQSIQNSLLAIFIGKYDKNAVDCSRIFYGGPESGLVHPRWKELNLERLFHAGRACVAEKADPINLSRELKKNPSFLNILKDDAKFFNSGSRKYKPPVFPRKKELPWSDLEDKIGILGAFGKGWHGSGPAPTNAADKCRMHFDEIKGLAFNLQYVPGGRKYMKDKVEEHAKNGIYPFTNSAYTKITRTVNKTYFPTNLENFSPYEEDLESGCANLVGLIHSHVTDFEPELIDPPKTLKLQDAENKMKEFFEEAVGAKDDSIYLLKCPTGMGKTELLTELKICSVVATPNHLLKDEVFGRVKSKNTNEDSWENQEVIRTEKLPECIPDDIISEINKAHNIGLHDYAASILNDFEDKASAEDKEEIASYKNSLALYFAGGPNKVITIVTTHHKAIIKRIPGVELVIFDEDMLNVILPIKPALLTDIALVAKNLQETDIGSYFKDILDLIMQKHGCETPPTPKFSIKQLERAIQGLVTKGVDIMSDLTGLPWCTRWVFDDKIGVIHYINNNANNVEGKVLVMSATADINLYKRIFKDRLKVLDISNVEIKGTFTQDYKYSCSRASLNNPNALKYINNKVNNLPVLTFMKYKANFENAIEEMHFGNCSGFDTYKGREIAVVGTPYPSPIMVKLIASALGAEIEDMPKTRNQIINRNGYRTKFNTYDDELLRDIHLGFIEGELTQAVGRARLLREASAAVRLFSNYPLYMKRED